jgi:hypothetical protein
VNAVSLRGLSADIDLIMKLSCNGPENIHLGKDPLWEMLTSLPSIQLESNGIPSLAAKSPFLLFHVKVTEVAIHPNQWARGEECIYEGTNRRKAKQGFHCISTK